MLGLNLRAELAFAGSSRFHSSNTCVSMGLRGCIALLACLLLVNVVRPSYGQNTAAPKVSDIWKFDATTKEQAKRAAGLIKDSLVRTQRSNKPGYYTAYCVSTDLVQILSVNQQWHTWIHM